MVSRLTGAHVIDHATASTSMVYGLQAQGYDAALLAVFGIERDELPTAMDAAAARRASLGRRGGAHRPQARHFRSRSAPAMIFLRLGAGLVTPGRFINVLGTAEVAARSIRMPVIDPERLVETHAFMGGHYFIENPGWLSGGALAWFRDTFGLAISRNLTTLAGAGAAGRRWRGLPARLCRAPWRPNGSRRRAAPSTA